MLRFIRKYQLIILAVGGSLLMVVFLFQPVLTRIAPSPLKAKVAMLADGSHYTRMDVQRANVAISLLKRVNPRALGPRANGGIGLDTTSESTVALHWLLLAKQAELAGLVGEAGDGASWIGDLALREAQVQAATEARQGLIQDEAQFMQRINELTPQINQMMNRNASLSASNAGGTMEDVYRILAQTRGIYRLLSSIQTMPAFSDVNAIYAAHNMLDAVAVDAVVLDSSLVTSAIDEPTQEQLQAFFDIYKAQAPSDNEFQIGYTQPTRIQLGWLTLDKNVFMNTVQVDRVELNKIWRQDRTQYPGDFASERFNLERQFRDNIATDMMIESDRFIRAQVLALTNGLPKVNGILTLPDDWASKAPKLDQIAQSLVEHINTMFSVNLPIPSVTMIGDRWLNANGIISLPGFGTSTFRVGSRQLPAYSLPQFFELTEPNTTGLDVQIDLPIVDPAATDQAGNRYYAVVIGVREQGPADTIEDVTREQVLSDYKSVEGYKLLVNNMDSFIQLIKENGSLAPAVDKAIAFADDPNTVTRPGVLRNIRVMRDTIAPGQIAASVDPDLNTETYRQAVLDSAKHIDPLADPETVATNPVALAVELPAARSIALSLVIAPRPITAEQFVTIPKNQNMTMAQGVIANTAMREIADASEGLDDPFSFNALSTRFGLVQLDEKSQKAKGDTESSTESEQG